MTDELTPERRAKLRRLAEAATRAALEGKTSRQRIDAYDAYKMASTPEDILALLDRLEAAEAEVTQLKADIQRHRRVIHRLDAAISPTEPTPTHTYAFSPDGKVRVHTYDCAECERERAEPTGGTL